MIFTEERHALAGSRRAVTTRAKIPGMTEQAKRGRDRRYKGDRVPLLTRVPRPVADRVREEAKVLNVSYTDFIATLLAQRYGLSPVAERPDQEQFPLTA